MFLFPLFFFGASVPFCVFLIVWWGVGGWAAGAGCWGKGEREYEKEIRRVGFDILISYGCGEREA